MVSMTKHSVNLKIQIRIVQLLLAFALAGLALLCAIYSTLVYYRLVSVAKANLTPLSLRYCLDQKTGHGNRTEPSVRRAWRVAYRREFPTEVS